MNKAFALATIAAALMPGIPEDRQYDRITAIGVSDGFEQGAGTAASLWEREKATPAYARGWAIGTAVRAAIESGNS